MQNLITHIGYLALFLLAGLSAFGIPVGSELAVAFGGALSSGKVLAGPHDHFALGFVILTALAGELVGSLAGYSLGRFGGRPLVDKVGRYLLLTHGDLDRAEAFLARRGDSFVVVGKLVPLLRSFISIVTGLSEMSIVRFAFLIVIGSTIFTSAIAILGYAMGASWHSAVRDFSDVGYVAGALAVVALGWAIAHRAKALRAEQSARLELDPELEG